MSAMEAECGMADSIAKVVALAKEPGNPMAHLKQIAQEIEKFTKCGCLRIYKLELSPPSFVQIAGTIPYSSPVSGESAGLTHEKKGKPAHIIEAVVSGRAQSIAASNIQNGMKEFQGFMGMPNVRSRIVHSIERSGTCLGIVDVQSTSPDHFTEVHQRFVAVAADVAMLLLEKDGIVALLKSMPTPVDYNLGREDFYSGLISIVAAASRMPFIMLRELRDQGTTLTAVQSWGFPDSDLEELSLSPLDDYPPFKMAIEEKRCVTEDSIDAGHLGRLRDLPAIKGVRSFVVAPINVANTILGTLSFGAGIEYHYTDIELRAFEVIANAIGVSITNYTNFYKANDALFQEGQASAAISTVEVAQAARHEAKNALDVAAIKLAAIGVLAKKSSTLAVIEDHAKRCDEALQVAQLAMDKIRLAAKPPQRVFQIASVKKMWLEAVQILQGKLSSNEVKVKVEGPDVNIHCAPDFLRHAFLHFLINSIDAFIERGIKRGRSITITITQTEKAVTIKYTDNAGGIDPSRLKPSMPPDEKVAQYIFAKEVTSKPEGSGYGMYLVRKILAEHKGSVNLLDYRNGIVFDINLPKGVNLHA